MFRWSSSNKSSSRWCTPQGRDRPERRYLISRRARARCSTRKSLALHRLMSGRAWCLQRKASLPKLSRNNSRSTTKVNLRSSTLSQVWPLRDQVVWIHTSLRILKTRRCSEHRSSKIKLTESSRCGHRTKSKPISILGLSHLQMKCRCTRTKRRRKKVKWSNLGRPLKRKRNLQKNLRQSLLLVKLQKMKILTRRE